MPVYVHVIDHPSARVLVDTGMTEFHPSVPIWILASVH
jgi:N-acyl homoserine lactone hydrolase